MTASYRFVIFLTLAAFISVTVDGSKCPPPCPTCPEIVPCPTPSCPVPKCPPLPNIPPCPVPRCPPMPDIPPCPTPVLNLTCPNVTCPPQSCPPCPRCPVSPTCPPCGSRTNSSASRVIPVGYQERPGLGTYKYYSTELNWNSANNTCASDGAYLVIPDTKDELAMLLNIMQQHGQYNIHIGFSDALRENTFLNVLGQPMTAQQDAMWKPGEPDSGLYFNCVYLNKNSRLLSDERCGDREPFVCELAEPGI